MSGHIDTRDGWQELDVVTPDSIYQLAEYDPADGSVVRAWVREAPVPPLPTEPYTVIRVTWEIGGEAELVLWGSGVWAGGWTPGELAKAITGFEVLAEPRIVRTYLMEEQRQALRRETAKAVLDDVRGIEYKFLLDTRAILPIYKKYGVES